MKSAVIRFRQQTGAVLVVSLVLLTVLTLIGVASMRSSSLEMRVASNAQLHNVAFQAAQSRLDFVSTTDTANPINFKIAVPDPNNPPVQDCNAADGCPDGAEWQTTATATFAGCAKDIGSSLESGKGVSTRYFDVQATGQTSGGLAYSTQRQGLRIPVAGCEEDS